MLQLSPRLYHAPCIRQAAKRHFSVSPRLKARPGVKDIKTRVDVATFRNMTVAEEPIVFRTQATPTRSPDNIPYKPALSLPALKAWLIPGGIWRTDDLSPYFREHLSHMVPYELILSSENDRYAPKASWRAFLDWLRGSPKDMHRSLFPLLEAQMEQHKAETDQATTDFVRFHAPLALLDAALHFNTGHGGPRVTQLYVAQADLADLPRDLQRDVPVPELLAGPATADASLTGDIYNSSLWLGLQPTFTPWHRDPNHNLFVQMCGSKAVRLLPPAAGQALFNKVMTSLGRPAGSSAIRGEEMMQGEEGQAWRDAVWGTGAPENVAEVVVRPRDALFVPKGWWHSVRSVKGHDGRLNASVNWWFRWRNASPPVDRRPPLKVW